jgi:NAD(P)-dependent dehydrogenase (short-subunit alcohol dehydrogenase family)
MDLIQKGRVALITGGSRGIGYAAADLLAAEGADVILVDINGDQAVASARRLAEARGVRTAGIKADISNQQSVADMVARAHADFGRIDILVNSAAVFDDKLFLESSAADWKRMLDVCLYGPLFCLHAILPGMVKNNYGRIICLASDAARVGQARLSYYAAAKAGVIALVKSIAQEVGPNGVTANVVSPGATDTELRQEREKNLRQQMGEEKYARREQTVLRMYPARRIGLPQDAGALITFLASEQASWITGQVISVNGGFAMP